MAYIRIRRGWEIPEREATPEHVYMDRRRFLERLSAVGLGTLGALMGCSDLGDNPSRTEPSGAEAKRDMSPSADTDLYPAERNPKYTLDRPLTRESVAAHYNNFYEFSTRKDEVARLVDRFLTRPWQVEVSGLVEKPGVYDFTDLIRELPLEERLYRLRCVEAWAMAVPWTGCLMSAFIKKAQPTSSARYVRMLTFYRPDQAPGQKRNPYPWPYFESLRMDEAMNELAMLVTGIYGHELPKQHGAPIRLIVPWKYGFKSIKSIVRIEFTDTQPTTFWNTLVPSEYGFIANVDPGVPHPRWSQASEVLIGTGERRPTVKYNGYGEYVAHLYER